MLKAIVAVVSLTLLSLEAILLANVKTKGYIITKKGDTLTCTFKLALNKYQVGKDSVYSNLQADSVKEYHLTKKNKSFRVISLQNKINPVFMLVIDTGKINLYQYIKSQGKSNIMYLLAQKGKRQPEIIFGPGGSKPERASLGDMIIDNSKLSGDFKNIKSYNEKTIIGIIRAYNNFL